METIKVSLVEDNHIIREGLETLLNSTEGFSCHYAFSNGEDAISHFDLLQSDIVLMDINLPGISGIETVSELKMLNPSLLFMMFTVYEEDEKVMEALKAGASGYILKKTQPTNILLSIRELYEGGSPMSALIARKVVSAFHEKQRVNNSELLSKRENEVLELLSKGCMYKEIADKLYISIGTV